MPVPPAKKTTKKTAAKKAAKERTQKKPMTATHKKALAAGRNEALTVNAYLAALNTPKRRGRKVSAATLRTRLNAAEERARIEPEFAALRKDVRLQRLLHATRQDR